MRDVARVELGAEDYGVNAYLSGTDSDHPRHHPAAGHQCAPPPPRAIKAELADAAKSFPKGLEYKIIWNPTEFISESMSEVQKTLLEAMLLVVLVIIVFLQSWRAAIIPIVAIPVSLIGTFAVLAGARLFAQHACRCSAWCWRSASSSTTPSSWSRMSSATSSMA